MFRKSVDLNGANGSNGSTKEYPALLLHFDVNKTVIQSDSIQLKSIEDGIREGIAELFWGETRKVGDKVTWHWSGAKPSCSPPSDDIRNVGTSLQNYAQYCKEACADKKVRKEAIKSFNLLGDAPVKKEMEKLLALTMKKMQLSPEVRYSKEAEAAGVKGPTFNMFPSVFHLVATLQRQKRTFAILFRSFGADHLKIKQEWNAFCELKHPIFSRLIEDIGAMDGSVPGIPDRRIHQLHTLYRDAQGSVLMLETFTNGPEKETWDSWAKAKPEPKSDTRNGRQYITQLKCKTVDGIGNYQKWCAKLLAGQQTAAIKDDWAWWQYKGEVAEAGKLLTVIPGRKPTHQIFFDDNIDHNNARIVDCRDERGQAIPHAKALNKVCVKVNPVEALLDNEYFLRKLLHATGDSLDVGASMMTLQKQLTEVEEEKAVMEKTMNDLNKQLKMLMDENRRMKLQRRINVRDEGELYTVLSKHKEVDLTQFEQGFRSLSELYHELEHGHCWLEVDENENIVRVIDMVFLKIQFKDLILIETHEQDSQQRVHTRNYLPGIITNVKEANQQKELDSWLENGLGVNVQKLVETDALPIYVPDAPNQQTGASKAYPITCLIQQSQGTYIIPEKEADINKDALAKIGLPGGKHFTTTDQDLHGGTITRFWRWDKKQTWEASAGIAGKEGRPPLDVAATCDKVFKDHPRATEYKKLLLQMFELFEAQLLTGGFSGSVVLRVQPFEADGRPGEPCIVKLDNGEAIRDEYINSVNVFKALPDRAARILGDPAYEKDPDGKEFGAMRLELAGACWNVPELAQGSANLLSTFKDLLLYESEQVMLSGSLAIADENRPFGNVNSILAETFGPGGVVSSLRKGGAGLRRADKDKPLTGMQWYTLKGKEGKFNLLTKETAEKKLYPPSDSMKRLFKEHFKSDMPKLKDLVQGQIKPMLEKMEKQSGRELCPLVGLSHGDLNAANIMIDALEAVWVIDFATSVELPLFTDMCKFEMACLFEYAVIPITPKLLVEFTSNSEEMWDQLNVKDWLGTDQVVCNYLLQKFHALPTERLHGLTQSDLDALTEEAVRKCPKPHKQRKYERSLKARLTADETVMSAAFSYCCNISDTLLQGETLGETLEIKGIPLPEGRGSRGAYSLRFFMEICVSVRRFMSQDMMNCLKEQKGAGDLMPVDWLSLQMWLPFLRESFRIIGYRDIPPMQKIWSIYHCSKVYQNTHRIQEKIQKNMGKLHQTDIMERLTKELELGKGGHIRSQKTDTSALERSDLEKQQQLQATSNWIHSYGAAFPQNGTCTALLRKVHNDCSIYGKLPGFYCPIWQVDGLSDAKFELGFEDKTRATSGKSEAYQLRLQIPNSEGRRGEHTWMPIGDLTLPSGKTPGTVTIKSRLLPMSTELLRACALEAGSQGVMGKVLSERFHLGNWSDGKYIDSTVDGADSSMEKRPSMHSPAAMALRMRKQATGALDNVNGNSKEHANKDLQKYLELQAIAVDSKDMKKADVKVTIGFPVYCYPPGSALCIDPSAEGFDQLRSALVVVRSITSHGLYNIKSASDPVQDRSETQWDPTPLNHTYLRPCRYEPNHLVMVNKSADVEQQSPWVNAKILAKATEDTDWLYKIEFQEEGLPPHQEFRYLDPMNSGRMEGVTADMFEEESLKIKQYLRVRSSFIIDSLSGNKLNVKECAPPTLRTKGVNFGLVASDKRLPKTQLRTMSLSATSSQGDESEEQGPTKGWQLILSTISTYQKGIPSCAPNAFLVLGSPGSGKTCMVSRLIMEIVDRFTGIMPLLLSVGDLVRRTAPDPELFKLDPAMITDWFDKYLRITFGEDSSRYLMVTHAIKMNRVMFIFEGLEDSGELKEVIEACIRLLIQERHLVLVTSRPLIGGQSSLEDISESIVAMQLENLSDEQIRTVAHARLGISGIETFDKIFAKLKSSQGGMEGEDMAMTLAQSESGPDGQKEQEVFGNPMMLSMLLCYLQTMMKKEAERKEALQRGEDYEDHRDGEQEQPDEANITSVYRVAIDVMLQRVQSKQQADRHNKEEKMEAYKRILEIMALHMTLHKDKMGDAIMANEVEQLLPRNLVQSWQPLKAAVIAGHAMFLRAQGESGKEELRFLVKDFQNFFSASAIAHKAMTVSPSGAQLPGLMELITDPGWSKVMEMLAEAWPQDYVQLIEKRMEGFQPTDGDSWLHIAARAGHRPAFQLLRQFSERNREALKKRSKDMRTPLHVAAEKGYSRLCLLMLEAGAPIEALDSNDRLPMHLAMQKGNFPTAKMLMSQWTDQMTSEYQIKVKKNRAQAEALASKVMNNLSEEDFKKAIDETFVELQYFGEKFSIDRKRTLGSLLAVFWICANHYQAFTRSQKDADKLSTGSWTKLQDWTNKTVGLTKNMKAMGAMLVYVTISNLGKIRPFLQAFAPEYDAPGEAITAILQRNPILVPSYLKLEDGLRDTILSAVKADFNLGQFLQAENFPANLLTVKQISGLTGANSIDVLGFLFFRILVMMCGIVGAKSLEGSLFMIDKQYVNYRLGLDVLSHLRAESVQQVYDRFLQKRSEAQELAFSASDPNKRALVRLACLTRAFDRKVGQEVAEAWNALDSESRQALMNFVNRDGVDSKPAFLLWNSPNLLANARTNSKVVGLLQALRMLLKIYEAAEQEYKGTDKPVVTIVCDEMAEHTMSVKDTESYANTKFEISRAGGYKSDSQGSVHRSPWQPLNDQSVLDTLSDEAYQLITDTMHSSVREPAFLKRLPQVFPELKYLQSTEDPLSKRLSKETLLALLTTYWVVSNQESSFTRSQEAEKKLSGESWKGIRELMDKSTLSSNPDGVNAILTVMAIHALGKLPKFRQQLAPEATNNQQVMAKVFEANPKVLPSYWRLSPQYRHLVQECLTRPFDFGQFLDAELVAGSLTSLKDMLQQDRQGDLKPGAYIHLYMFSVFGQMSACLSGVQSLEGSLCMTQEKWTEFKVGLEAIEGLEQEREAVIHERFLQAKGRQMGLPWRHDKESQALVRVACLCGISDPDLALKVQQEFESLDQEEYASLVRHLTADGFTQKPGFVLKSARAYLESALANQQVGLLPALRILNKVYQQVAKDFARSSRPLVTINFERLATFAKNFTGSVTFQDLPFEMRRDSETEALVIPKVWIPVKNQSVLDSLKKKGKELAADLIAGRVTEKSFKTRVEAAFPELSYFKDVYAEKKDQTLCAMLSVFWLVRDQYDSFIRAQTEDSQLSRQSWAWIQDWMRNEVKLISEETIDSTLTFMAIHALGKIDEFRTEMAPNFDAQAHDPALAHILESQPEVVPSYQRLPEKYKKLIRDSLSVDFQFSQFVQAENVAANLVVVKEKLKPHGDDGFAFFCFRIFVQICGKLGPRGMQGSLFMTEQQFQRFRPGLSALQQLRTREAHTAYNAFLLLQGAKALSRFASPEHKALSRLLCLGSASDLQAGNEICEAFDQLAPGEREKLIRMLTADGVEQRPGYVLCEAPDLLKAAQANPSVGLPAALRMMVRTQERCTADKSVFKVYVHLSSLADWAKDAESLQEFGQARLDFRYEDQFSVEDQTKTRLYRIEVSRPNSTRTGTLVGGTEAFDGCLGRIQCCMPVLGFVLMLSALGAAAAAIVAPDTLASVTSMLPESLELNHVAAILIAVAIFLLCVLCCSCRSRGGGRLKMPGGSRTLCCDYSGRPEARPLICCYSLLESRDESLV